MHRLTVESDGIVFGYTRRPTTPPGGRTYKSMNYHRHSNFKQGKTIWHSGFPVSQEPIAFDESDFEQWVDGSGNLWWISRGATTAVGAKGERLAFFPVCQNHPGPWHGYPVSPRDDEAYEVPPNLIMCWETAGLINKITAGRMRRGKI